jgi:CRP/FNR family cyclic AMP-dependent transcriptional regulator
LGDSTRNLLLKHPFLYGMGPDLIHQLDRCAARASFRQGEYVWLQGQPADRLFLIISGQVSLEIQVPHMGPERIDTVSAGDALGFPGLDAPYRWKFDARAITDVDALALDGKCLRECMEANHPLGYQMLKSYLPVIWRRLEAARLKLLNVEGAAK